MPEGLFHKGEIDVACYKMRRQRMLQHMWVPLGWLKPGCRGDRLEHPEKLGAVKASSLLRREQIARTVFGAFAEPRLDYSDLVQGTPTRRHALGRLPTPPPLPENLLLRLHKKLPSEPPASTQEVSESENRPATRGTAHSEVQGDARGTTRCTARCRDRPIAALHFLPPV